MEVFSWAMHKYVMHGFLWSLHRSHHIPPKGFFELNDVFPVIFGSISVAFMFSGIPDLDWPFWVGTGIAAYGMIYFLLHDVIVHRRIRWKMALNNRYLKAVIRAHKIHHSHLNRDGGECFGLLLFPKKFLKK
jgi:beta-carotene 3-hydroxylase